MEVDEKAIWIARRLLGFIALRELLVIHVNPINGAQTPVSTGGLFANPIGLAIEASGNILVSDQTTLINGAVIRVTPVGGAQTPVSTD